MKVKEIVPPVETSLRVDWDQILAESGVLAIAPLDPEKEINSWREPVRIKVEFQPGRSMLDLISLEDELEVLLGQKLELITPAGLAAEDLNRVIAPDGVR